MSSNDPADPFTELATAATHLHELHTELVKSGFPDGHALRMVTAVLLEPLRAATPCPHCGRTRE